jgi:hypothetical protein
MPAFHFLERMRLAAAQAAEGDAPAVGPRPAPPPEPTWSGGSASEASEGPSAQAIGADTAAAYPDERDIALSNLEAKEERWANDASFQRTLAKYGKRPPVEEDAVPEASPEPERDERAIALARLAASEARGNDPGFQATLAKYAPAPEAPAAAAPAPGMPDERDIALSNLQAKEDRWAQDEELQKTLAKYRR